MKTHVREKLVQLAATALLSIAGIAAAQEASTTLNSTGCRRASDKVYSFYDDQVTAGMRFGETYAAVTTQLEGSDTNWHLVTLMINCSDGGGSYRTYASLKQSRTLRLYCPNPEGFPPQYFVTDAWAILDDFADTIALDEEDAQASTRVDIEDPSDAVPPRSSGSGEHMGGDRCE